MNKKIYQAIAAAVGACKRCEEKGNQFGENWRDYLELLQEELPRGSGFNSGTEIDFDESGDEKVVLTTSYHHMNDGGYYCGWTDHKIIITPSFRGFDMKITGPNKNDIKEYISDTFSHCLDQPAPEMVTKKPAAV